MTPEKSLRLVRIIAIPLCLSLFEGCSSQKLAEKSDAEAQYQLGFNYETGNGVPRDIQKAMSYYQLAAAQGHPWAKSNLLSLQKSLNDQNTPTQGDALAPSAVTSIDSQRFQNSSSNEVNGTPSLTEKSAQTNRKATKSSVAIARSTPSDEYTNTEIDKGFMLWSSAWMMDRYLPKSAHVINKGVKDNTYYCSR